MDGARSQTPEEFYAEVTKERRGSIWCANHGRWLKDCEPTDHGWIWMDSGWWRSKAFDDWINGRTNQWPPNEPHG